MRKKIVSGLLAMTMVFTSVPADVIAIGTGEINENTQINNSLFGNLFGDLFGTKKEDTSSSENNNSSSNSSLFGGQSSSGNNSNSNSNSNSNNQSAVYGGNSNTNNNTTSNNQGSLFGGNSTSTQSGGLFGATPITEITITSKVVDAEENGLEAVTITVVDKDGGDVTLGSGEGASDTSGDFTLTFTPDEANAPYTVTIEAEGYLTRTCYILYDEETDSENPVWVLSTDSESVNQASSITLTAITTAAITGTVSDDVASVTITGGDISEGGIKITINEVDNSNQFTTGETKLPTTDSDEKAIIYTATVSAGDNESFTDATYYCKYVEDDWKWYTDADAKTEATTPLAPTQVPEETIVITGGGVAGSTITITDGGTTITLKDEIVWKESDFTITLAADVLVSGKEYTVTVSKEGYLTGEFTLSADTKKIDLIIKEIETTEITGTVTPADATVVIGSDTITATNGKFTSTSAVPKTDEDGNAIEYTVTVSATGYLTAEFTCTHDSSEWVWKGNVVDGTLTLEESAFDPINGTITDSDDKGIADATVTIYEGDTTTSVGSTKTGTDGTFSIPLANDLDISKTYTVKVSKDGYVAGEFDLTKTADAWKRDGYTYELDVEVKDPVTYNVTLTGDTGYTIDPESIDSSNNKITVSKTGGSISTETFVLTMGEKTLTDKTDYTISNDVITFVMEKITGDVTIKVTAPEEQATTLTIELTGDVSKLLDSSKKYLGRLQYTSGSDISFLKDSNGNVISTGFVDDKFVFENLPAQPTVSMFMLRNSNEYTLVITEVKDDTSEDIIATAKVSSTQDSTIAIESVVEPEANVTLNIKVVDTNNKVQSGVGVSINLEGGTDVGLKPDATNSEGISSIDVTPGMSYDVTIYGGDGKEIETKTVVVPSGGATAITETFTITADTTAEKYTVTYFDIVNGSEKTYTESVEEGSTYSHSLTTSVKDYMLENNLEFSEWGIYKTGSNTNIASTLVTSGGVSNPDRLSFSMPSYDITIYIIPKQIDGLNTVTFDTTGGTGIKSLSVQSGEKIDLSQVQDTTKKGYTFTDWYKNSTLTQKWNFDTDVVTSNTTLYAGWIGNEINIVIDYDGSTGNSGQINSTGLTTGKVRVGDQFTLKAGTKSGHSLYYWFWTSNFEEIDAIPNNGSNSVSIVIPELDAGDTLNVYAVWQALSATIHIENIIEPETDGDSCYVSITSSEHGTIEGEYVRSDYSSHEVYSFDLADYGTGMYTVEVSTTSGQEMVSVIYVVEDSANTTTIKMLPVDKVVSVSNNTTNVPNITSNNLSEMFTSSELSNSNYISIEMEVNNVTADNVHARIITESINTNQQIGMFLDVNLIKYDNGTKYSMHETPNSKGLNVTVQLPDSFKDQKGYFVSTVHNDMFSTISSASVSYNKDSNSISFNTKNLSVFGIGFTGTSSGTGSGSTGVQTYIPTAEGYSIPIFQNVQVGQWIIGLGKYQLVHPEPTKYKFAGWYFASTGQALTAKELEAFEVTTEILTHGIFPRFVQVDADGNPVTTPVPSTGSAIENEDVTLKKLF